MITATFTITESEYIELQKLYLSGTSANRIKYALLAIFGFSGIPKGALSSEDCAGALQLISSRLPALSRKLAKAQGR